MSRNHASIRDQHLEILNDIYTIVDTLAAEDVPSDRSGTSYSSINLDSVGVSLSSSPHAGLESVGSDFGAELNLELVRPLSESGGKSDEEAESTNSEDEQPWLIDRFSFMQLTSALYIMLHTAVEETHICFPKSPAFRQPQLGLLEWAHHNDLGHFLRKLCLRPMTFDLIVTLIENHQIFHNSSNSPQYPTALQLGIFLVRVGHYGNAALCNEVAEWAGVSVSTVVLSTKLTDDEKQSAKAFVQSKLVTLPHNLRIVDYALGHTGSVHNSYAFEATQISHDHALFLDAEEWIWADSAYPIQAAHKW
ncbi:hypothetical protein SERLADRAFT_409092 [Serpula lacrymans var. lacrymans S7.9]|uniref:Uncharacterized protein n=1 Tax=Serpula lacrymans var. lacrymans (strain S7.9) TaxID=578457 RepID=F8NZ20_SERL9|nr:uncharacterized protein SERLADRAFT_409092 [Serpula lacrymans var. lacrymans S7.9]EGO23840.1 hypothetical protein SERLADRAFT_409092 [Serpula lacrymans var. lacrymans S7.9]